MPFQTQFDFRHTTRIVHGPGSIACLADFFSPKDKVLIVTDRVLEEIGTTDLVAATLGKIPYAVYIRAGSASPGKISEPSKRCVDSGHRIYKKERCTALIGLGGGSPMDVAKMIGVLATNGGQINQYLGADKVTNDLPFLACVPTTYGTASEVTPFAVLDNPKSGNKDPVISWKVAPKIGVLDPELSIALPASVGASTGMDALTHALESYINLMATPITEGIALHAIQLIGENLRLACANDHELAATENMLIASMMAGLAFSQTRLGNVHAMSHPVGARYHVHHGLANAILLPYVMEFNLLARPAKFAIIAETLGADTSGLDQREAAQLAVDTVRDINDDLGIPAKLGDVGVKKTHIRPIAKAAMLSGNIAVNPRKTSQRDLETIFHKAI
jgi:alcohol dehydrogenase class IV